MAPTPRRPAPGPLTVSPANPDFLTAHAHNFIRLWRWENFRSQAAGGGFHLCMTPQPWPRTGLGHAVDGKPKFDLTRADEAFYSRLRERVAAAGAAGIYVAVMLFEGWGLHLSEGADRVEGGLPAQGRGHRARPSQRAVRGGQRVLR